MAVQEEYQKNGFIREHRGRMMKKRINKKTALIASIALAVILIVYSVTDSVHTAQTLAASNHDASTLQSALTNAVQLNTDPSSAGKEETVYAIGDANGNLQEVIVSDWLKNTDAADKISDYSELGNVENTKGDETFSQSGNSYVWDAAGSDIHYQGTTDQALPVAVAVTYYLNGQKIDPADLNGKSGHVKIRFDYTNTAKVYETVNGESIAVYVPFVMVSGTILNGDTFNNVSVTNGTVYNDGSRNIVLGCACPGLSDSLNVSESSIDIPDYVEIEADTTDFSLSGTMSLGTSELFNNIEISSGSVDELTSSLTQLKDAATSLVSGATELYAGSETLYSGCGSLVSGAQNLLAGADQLKTGAQSANTGADDLRDGLGTLSSQSATLDAGALQLVNGVFSSAGTQLSAAVGSSVSLTPDTYVATIAYLTSQTSDPTLIGELSALKSQLDSTMQFYNGLGAYTDGVDDAYAGAQTLADGTALVQSGATTLYGGVYQLYEGSTQVLTGAGSLKDGIAKLSQGESDFYTQGIEQLVSGLGGNYQDLANRLEAITEAGRGYQSFAGIADGVNGSVKFIYRTDSIGE